jgi:hypothetical protein
VEKPIFALIAVNPQLIKKINTLKTKGFAAIAE